MASINGSISGYVEGDSEIDFESAHIELCSRLRAQVQEALSRGLNHEETRTIAAQIISEVGGVSSELSLTDRINKMTTILTDQIGNAPKYRLQEEISLQLLTSDRDEQGAIRHILQDQNQSERIKAIQSLMGMTPEDRKTACTILLGYNVCSPSAFIDAMKGVIPKGVSWESQKKMIARFTKLREAQLNILIGTPVHLKSLYWNLINLVFRSELEDIGMSLWKFDGIFDKISRMTPGQIEIVERVFASDETVTEKFSFIDAVIRFTHGLAPNITNDQRIRITEALAKTSAPDRTPSINTIVHDHQEPTDYDVVCQRVEAIADISIWAKESGFKIKPVDDNVIQHASIIKFLMTTPLEERDKIVRIVIKMGWTGAKDKAEIMWCLLGLSREDRKEACLILSENTTLSRSHWINELKELIPSETNWESQKALISEFIKLEDAHRQQFLQMVSEVPADKKEMCLNLLGKLMTPNMTLIDRTFAFNQIEQCKNIIEMTPAQIEIVERVFSSKESIEHKINFIPCVSFYTQCYPEISDEERIRITESLAMTKLYHWGILDHIATRSEQTIQWIEKFGPLLMWAKEHGLITARQDSFEVTSIAEALQEIPPKERDETIDLVLEIHWMPAIDKANLIRTLVGLSLEDKKAACRILSKVRVELPSDFITEMNALRSHDTGWASREALIFELATLSPFVRKNIAVYLAEIDRDQQDDFLNLIHLLVTPEMNERERDSAWLMLCGDFQNIIQLPLKQREIIHRVFGSNELFDQKLMFITTLQRLTNRHQDIEISLQQRLRITEALARMSVDERLLVFSLYQDKESDYETTCQRVEEISHISVLARQHGLTVETQSFDERIAIFKCLLESPVEDREEFIVEAGQNLQLFFSLTKMDQEQRTIALKSLQTISPSDELAQKYLHWIVDLQDTSVNLQLIQMLVARWPEIISMPAGQRAVLETRILFSTESPRAKMLFINDIVVFCRLGGKEMSLEERMQITENYAKVPAQEREELFQELSKLPDSTQINRLIQERLMRNLGFHQIGMEFQVHPLAIELCPEAVLKAWNSNSSHKFLNDELRPDEGLDGGGPTRQFLSSMCHAMFKQEDQRRLIQFENSLPCVKDPLSEEDQIVLKKLGQLFSRIGRTESATSGRVVPDQFFEILVIDALYEGFEKNLYTALNLFENDPMRLPIAQYCLGDETKKQAATEALKWLLYPIEDAEKCIQQVTEPYLRLSSAIKEGFEEQFKVMLIQEGAQYSSARIQGKEISAQQIIGQLHYQGSNGAAMEEKIKWLKEIIKEHADDKEWLATFLKAVTGQTTLLTSTVISIKNDSTDCLFARVCFNELHLPRNPMDKDRFRERVADLIASKDGYTFQ